MIHLSSIFQRKVFGLVLFFVFGFITVIYAFINKKINERQEWINKLFNDFYEVDMVPDKPDTELIAYPNMLSIYDKTGKCFGKLLNNPVVYCPNGNKMLNDSLINVEVYGWVWTKSLNIGMSVSRRLMTQENIRYRANSHVIARLNARTKLKTIYTNGRSGWTLVFFKGFVSKKSLITQKKFKNIPWLKRFFSDIHEKRTLTTRTGGIPIKPASRPAFTFEEFTRPVRLAMLLYLWIAFAYLLSAIYISKNCADKNRKRIKVVVAFALGILIGVLYLNAFQGN